jgi:hypothetical protein
VSGKRRTQVQEPQTERSSRDVADERRAVPQSASGGSLTPEAVLGLQNTIGNQAVQRLLDSRRGPEGVQRDPIDPEHDPHHGSRDSHREQIDPAVDYRSPFAESLVNQVSVVHAAISGRALTSAERALARPTFGLSLDFSRVRIIEGEAFAGTTVGNTIRLPEGFDISNAPDAELLIHELTHVWQYQHDGTDYISESLHTQILGHIHTGNRNAAYDYVPDASRSFFDFTPEQQAYIVQNHFGMVRDQRLLGTGQTQFQSNHQGRDGFPMSMTAAQRRAEIAAELPIHQTYLGQMQQALPNSESQILIQRGEDLMRMPLDDLVPQDRRSLPVNPLFEVRF